MTDETTTLDRPETYDEVMAPLRAAWSDEVRDEVQQLRAQLQLQTRLQRARTELGLSQTQAAELTGVDQGDISKMESGRLTPSPKRALRYLEALENAAETGLAAAVGAEPFTTAPQAARYLLSVQSETARITQLKLQKLLYYAQGYSLGLLGQRLFKDRILRWDYGPVVTRVRAMYHDSGDSVLPPPDNFDVLSVPPRARLALERAFADYGEKGAVELVGQTHLEPPWKETPKDAEIPVSKIAAFFQEQLKPL